MDFFELIYYAEFFISYDASDPFKSFWMSLVIAGALFLVLYVLQAVALWTISGREGYKHRWMAFVPILNTYYIGVVSDKNRFYHFPAKSISAALAVVELLLVIGNIIDYAVAGIVYAGNLYEPVYSTYFDAMILSGYTASAAISNTWLGWIFDNLDAYVLTWVNLVYILLHVLVVITFFQTYACRRYVIMSIASVFFPVKAILMFAVRNNRGLNYRDYVRGEQRRRYEMYQQYSDQNGGNNYGGYNPYSGRPSAPPPGNPYSSSSGNSSSAEDPFDGLGSSSGSSSSGDDPFDELKS